VVEGVGDHGCEYMTGGVVVVLGQTGRNFAAGMSGGVAYIYDPKNEFKQKANLEMVELETLHEDEDVAQLQELLENHLEHTGSSVAGDILKNLDKAINSFVKVMPKDYKRVLTEARRKMLEQNISLEVALYG